MAKRFLNVHPDILRLGFVSFLTDISSEAIFSVFSIFFTTVAGASAALLGVVEGLADFSASSLDYISGFLSDKYGKRKIFAALGYGFSTLAKIFLIIANSVSALATFRIVERLGKSFRGPPRDAWLSTVAEKGNRGYSFGVHKALDKMGAVIGPLVAYEILNLLGSTPHAFKTIFVTAFVFAILAVVILSFMKEPDGVSHQRENIFRAWRTLSHGFKLFLLPASIFSLAYFSFSFLLLKAYDVGFAIKDVVLLYALFNVAFVIFSPFVGKIGDAIGRRFIIISEYVIYTIMAVGFIFASKKWEVIILFILFGVFYSIDEGQGKAFIADLEKEKRATAIGLYNFLTGIAYLFASAIAGILWVIHPALAFGAAAIITVIAMIIFISLQSKITKDNELSLS